VVENHDVVRAPTRYGGGVRGAARARAAALAVLGLPGAAYLYQGQELGLPEVEVAPEHRQDPAFARTGRSRDGARVPLPWAADPRRTHGFSATDVPPWLPVPSGWGRYAVETEREDSESMLPLTRRAVSLRRSLLRDGILGPDAMVEVSLDNAVLTAHYPSGFLLVVNMGEDAAPLPAGNVLLASAELDNAALPADAAAWLTTTAD
jgi:alpha-glucosidase